MNAAIEIFSANAGALPRRTLAGVDVPDTALVARAIEYVSARSEPWLFNHVMRSWLFAEALAQRSGKPYDAEVLAVSTLLHDLGLTDAFTGPLRFEVEGANAARAFARNEGIDERRGQLIWDSVALNSTPSICLHKETEAAMCVSGVGLDWGGWGYDSVAKDRIAEIVAAFPRLEMKRQFTRAVCHLAETRPETTFDNFARDFGERFVPNYKPVSMVDLLTSAPFDE
jgi:hypothetical protein